MQVTINNGTNQTLFVDGFEGGILAYAQRVEYVHALSSEQAVGLQAMDAAGNGSYSIAADPSVPDVLEPALLGETSDQADAAATIAAAAAPVLPFVFDNTTLKYASLVANSSDSGMNSGSWALGDGVNTVYGKMQNIAGGGGSKSVYDNGGGTGWDINYFGSLLVANTLDGDLDVNTQYGEFAYVWTGFALGWDLGTTLYLKSTTGHHEDVSVRACGSVSINGAVAADHVDVDVSTPAGGAVAFAAVAPGGGSGVGGIPDPALGEWLDTSGAGSDTLSAASLVAAVNDPTMQAAILAALGFAVTAIVDPSSAGVMVPATPERVIFDPHGNDFTLTESTGTARINLIKWDNYETALNTTPGSDMS